MNHTQSSPLFHFWKGYYPLLKMRFLNTQVPTWYDLQKFGLTPAKLIHRLFPSIESPRVIFICIPKSGTNLLERAICLHPRLYRKLLPVITPNHLEKQDNLSGLLKGIKPGQLLLSHLTYTPERAAEIAASGVKTIMMVRNPRDIVISRLFYALRFLGHPCHGAFKDIPDLKGRIKLSIIGDNSLGVDSIRKRLEDFSGWLGTADYIVRFEDIIGSKGGGSDKRQNDTLKDIYKTIRLELNEKLLEHICIRIFSTDSPTFHKGIVNQWQDSFDTTLETFFTSQVGDNLLEKYGYK